MNSNGEYIPKRAMSIHAHPDDQEFSIGGTLAKWAQAGCEIISVVITSGDSGSNDPSKNADYKPVLAELREKEQLAANAVLGIQETIFLRYPDGELEPTISLRKELTRLIRKLKPDTVLTGNPEAWFYGNEYLNHPDHRAGVRVDNFDEEVVFVHVQAVARLDALGRDTGPAHLGEPVEVDGA